MRTEDQRRKALRRLLAARGVRKLDENHFLSTAGVLADKHKEALEDHGRELRGYGLDPDLVGEHEVKPILCPCCKTVIPWRTILGVKG